MTQVEVPAATGSQDDKRQELVDFVLDQTVSPVDHWGVAATLESRGLRDVDAVEKFGCADIFALAEDVYARCRAQLRAAPPAPEPGPARRWYARLGRFVLLYARGTFFAMPMAIQIVSVLVLGYALWASVRFNELQATAVALATILSFVVTGGFVQVIGRLGLFYSEQKSYLLAERVVHKLIRTGLAVAVAVGAATLLVDLLTSYFPLRLALVGLVYYLLLSALWLFLAVLYTLQRRLAILLTMTVGIGVIALVLRFTPFGLYAAHWAGLAGADVAALVWGRRLLRRNAAGVAGDLELARLPRLSILGYSSAPYFAYGVLYFGFLFLDRVVGWSTADDPLPFLILFRTPYELGLDWALLSMVLTIALLEYTINEFSSIIIPVQKRFSAFDIAAHNRYFRRFYARQLIMLVILTVASAVATYKGVLWFRQFDELKQVRDFFASPITFRVFYWGVIGYGLLVWALLNCVFFFSLSRPWLVLRPLVAAVATDAVVGFVLSRVLDYSYSVVGLAVGSLVFALMTARHAARVLGQLDYYYYSAY